MSGVVIKITPDQARGVARAFSSASTESKEMVNRLHKEMDGLRGNWEGMTQQHFYQEYEAWKTQMNRFSVVLEDINKQLLVIAKRFEDADKAV